MSNNLPNAYVHNGAPASWGRVHTCFAHWAISSAKLGPLDLEVEETAHRWNDVCQRAKQSVCTWYTSRECLIENNSTLYILTKIVLHNSHN